MIYHGLHLAQCLFYLGQCCQLFVVWLGLGAFLCRYDNAECAYGGYFLPEVGAASNEPAASPKAELLVSRYRAHGNLLLRVNRLSGQRPGFGFGLESGSGSNVQTAFMSATVRLL